MPKRVDHDQRRNLIASAAASSIAEQGLERTTMREIAARSGVSKGIVEHYFKNRDDVISSALEWVNVQFIQREAATTTGLNGLEALRARLHCILPLNATTQREWKVRLCFWSVTATNPQADEARPTRLALTRERYLSDLKQAQLQGEIAANTDIQQSASELAVYIAGLASGALIDPSHYSKPHLKRLVDRTIRHLAEGNGHV